MHTAPHPAQWLCSCSCTHPALRPDHARAHTQAPTLSNPCTAAIYTWVLMTVRAGWQQWHAPHHFDTAQASYASTRPSCAAFNAATDRGGGAPTPEAHAHVHASHHLTLTCSPPPHTYLPTCSFMCTICAPYVRRLALSCPEFVGSSASISATLGVSGGEAQAGAGGRASDDGEEEQRQVRHQGGGQC